MSALCQVSGEEMSTRIFIIKKMTVKRQIFAQKGCKVNSL